MQLAVKAYTTLATMNMEICLCRTLAASAVKVLAEVVVKGGPSAELAMAEESAVPATIALIRQALAWASWLESICKPGLDLLTAMAASGTGSGCPLYLTYLCSASIWGTNKAAKDLTIFEQQILSPGVVPDAAVSAEFYA